MKNFLKNVFDWIREALEAADVPFVLMLLVILPFVVPFTPAWVTGMNLYTIMKFPDYVAYMGGATIELLGFAGAILFVRSIMDYIQKKDPDEIIRIWLTGISYVFYLVSVIVINIILDIKAGKDWSYIWVIAALCLLSVPSGLLSASRIVKREDDSRGEKRHQENRSDRMSRWLIKHGMTPREYSSDTKLVQHKKQYASDYKKQVITQLEKHYSKTNQIMGASELCKILKLEAKTQRAEIWKQIQAWKQEKHL
jgi:hypothetical protein